MKSVTGLLHSRLSVVFLPLTSKLAVSRQSRFVVCVHSDVSRLSCSPGAWLKQQMLGPRTELYCPASLPYLQSSWT
ncbi:hypothetical protein BU25DRAFT_2425 [Macroventuria anomochaeta]|uniref:Uncharacterized protein n=1 Tax=Macroventuria anomochaeta TaxID=301207 RepID=A0ACB6SH12_9PLEO|nr:uncharacterized protein BU25DRAFT_2425 [Macroventuria anomochaeta]KAF2633242.1 hypothetical protein BU25DRAFT_2425 [Macroventuria anomochaeta]